MKKLIFLFLIASLFEFACSQDSEVDVLPAKSTFDGSATEYFYVLDGVTNRHMTGLVMMAPLGDSAAQLRTEIDNALDSAKSYTDQQVLGDGYWEKVSFGSNHTLVPNTVSDGFYNIFIGSEPTSSTPYKLNVNGSSNFQGATYHRSGAIFGLMLLANLANGELVIQDTRIPGSPNNEIQFTNLRNLKLLLDSNATIELDDNFFSILNTDTLVKIWQPTGANGVDARFGGGTHLIDNGVTAQLISDYQLSIGSPTPIFYSTSGAMSINNIYDEIQISSNDELKLNSNDSMLFYISWDEPPKMWIEADTTLIGDSSAVSVMLVDNGSSGDITFKNYTGEATLTQLLSTVAAGDSSWLKIAVDSITDTQGNLASHISGGQTFFDANVHLNALYGTSLNTVNFPSQRLALADGSILIGQNVPSNFYFCIEKYSNPAFENVFTVYHDSAHFSIPIVADTISSAQLKIVSNGTEVMHIEEDLVVINDSTAIGHSSPTSMLDINDELIRVRTSKTPSSSTDDGYTGEIAWDANYIYVCTSGDGPGGTTDTWKRTAISTW